MQIHTSLVTEATPVQLQQPACIEKKDLKEKGDLIDQLITKVLVEQPPLHLVC